MFHIRQATLTDVLALLSLYEDLGYTMTDMAASGLLLYLAQRSIPMGTAYAVWTGIGAFGAFAVGIAFFNDPATLGRTFGAILIVGGVVVMKLSA